MLRLYGLVHPYWHTLFDLFKDEDEDESFMSDCVKCMRGTNYCQILLVTLISFSSFFYHKMERKHQDEIVFQNFVMKDNFYIGVLITIVEYGEC